MAISADEQLLIDASLAQDKIENSGISLVGVKTNNSAVKAAISRIFGEETDTITFEMFKQATRGLYRAGIINGYENA